MKEVFIS